MNRLPVTLSRRRRCASGLAILAGLGTLLGAASTASAQSCPAGSYCYYTPPILPTPIAAANNYGGDIVLSSPAGTITGTYTVNGGAAKPFSVTAGTPFFITLALGEGLASAFKVAEKRGAFIVASAASLIVDQRVKSDFWQSSSTVKNNVVGLGTRFRAGGYSLNLDNLGDTTGYDFLSFYAPTAASITVTAPPGAAAPFWNDGVAGLVHTFSLQPGQTYVLRSNTGADIDGALVTSDQPISVATGGRGYAPAGCGDDGMDHLVPTSLLGTKFVVDDYPSDSREQVRVITDTDGTGVLVNGALAGTINAGEYFEPTITGLTFIETSKPAYVFQNAGNVVCELDVALIPPVFFANLASVNTSFDVIGAGVANVIIPTVSAGSLKLDDVAAVPTLNNTIPGHPEWSRVRINVPGGSHSISATSDFQLGLVSSVGVAAGLFAYYSDYRLPNCGDGAIAANETCDDGNVADGDGCSAVCQTEDSFVCTGQPSICKVLDTDMDGLPDLIETQLGYDPTKADADGDGVLDPLDIDLDNDGIPNDVECNAGALSLVNGSFEMPVIPPNTFNLVNQSMVPGWDTTASDELIEIWGTGYKNIIAPQGVNFAELNALQVSTLYQDVATTPGQIYYYRFYHHGVFGDDTLEFDVGAPGAPVEIRTVTTGNMAWQLVTGLYTVPAGQTTSRFSFVSVSAAGGSPTGGNLLDGITFTPGCTVDTDGDGTLDFRDTDSDGDGLLDGIEAGHGKANAAGVVPGPYGTDGIADSVETAADSGAINYTLADFDKDSLPDFQDTDLPAVPTDTDMDGLDDDTEIALGYDPTKADADGDGIKDPVDDDLDNDGIPNAIECNAEAFSLINGDFETPIVTPGTQGSHTEDMVPGWDTTAPDNVIEITGNGFEGVSPASGVQWAELNGLVPATFYQDVATTPGQIYYYRFYHRGRYGVDTMSFRVDDPAAASPIKIRDVSTDKTAWQLVTGLYTVPAGQTTTRFSFVSVSAAGGLPASGNFLDGIAFTPGCTVDTDGDAMLDFRDLDSDNDTLLDGIEAGHGKAGADGIVPGPYGSNGLADSVETTSDSGSLNYTVADTDADLTYDFRDLDSDGDLTDDKDDEFPTNPAEIADKDVDTIGDNADNCPDVANADQADADKDGMGDACEPPPVTDGWHASGDGCNCVQAGTAPRGSSGLLPIAAAALLAMGIRRRRSSRQASRR